LDSTCERSYGVCYGTFLGSVIWDHEIFDNSTQTTPSQTAKISEGSRLSIFN
jgi:hypothetical protein